MIEIKNKRFISDYTFVLDLAKAQSISDILNNLERYKNNFYQNVSYDGFLLSINDLIGLVESLVDNNYELRDIIQVLLEKDTYLYGKTFY